MSVIKAEQAVGEVNAMFEMMGVKQVITSFQEDNIYYVELNPFLLGMTQEVGMAPMVLDSANTFFNAKAMFDFRVNHPEVEVTAKNVKAGGATLVVSVSLTEFVQKMNYLKMMLMGMMLAQKQQPQVAVSEQKAVATQPLVKDTRRFKTYELRNYRLDSQKMLIVPTNKGGAVLKVHLGDNKVVLKFALCSRDDKFDLAVGKQMAQQANEIEVKVPNGSYQDRIMAAMMCAYDFDSVQQASQFKKVRSLFMKALKMEINNS